MHFGTLEHNYVGQQHERERFLARDAINKCSTTLEFKQNGKISARMKFNFSLSGTVAMKSRRYALCYTTVSHFYSLRVIDCYERADW